MDDRFFERPILNSPYSCPARHWELDEHGQPTGQIVETRRSAKFITPIPRPRKHKDSSEQARLVFDEGAGLSTIQQQYDPTPVINELRRRVDQWRAISNPSAWGVTPETARLLHHWRHHEFTDLRPFFCQIEAVETVRRERGLVIADFSARNIERLRTFCDIALELGRRLVVTTKDAYLLQHMHVIDPKIPSPDEDCLAILRTPRGSTRDQWERDVLERFSSSVTSAAAIKNSPGDHLLCLSYWDITNLIDLEPVGGTYIYSASEAYDEEQRFDHERLNHWLDHFGLRKVGGLAGAEQGPFHASGHIDGPGMEWVIETINPARILPVHTQKLGWFETRWPEKVVRARYGEAVRFD